MLAFVLQHKLSVLSLEIRIFDVLELNWNFYFVNQSLQESLQHQKEEVRNICLFKTIARKHGFL